MSEDDGAGVEIFAKLGYFGSIVVLVIERVSSRTSYFDENGDMIFATCLILLLVFGIDIFKRPKNYRKP